MKLRLRYCRSGKLFVGQLVSVNKVLGCLCEHIRLLFPAIEAVRELIAVAAKVFLGYLVERAVQSALQQP
jgi:hypothetical protein